MSCKVFISYRRDDSRDATTWLYDKLSDQSSKFSKPELFLDTGSIWPGDVWPEEIIEKLEEAPIFLVIINKNWLTTGVDGLGKRRIDNKKDWVRKEIETAIKKGKTIIPVLIDGTKMPTANLLPSSIQMLFNLQCCEINVSAGFNSGIEPLKSLLSKTLVRINMPDKLRDDLDSVIATKYEIIRKIGVGARFTVYLTRDKALDREVTIRVLQDVNYKDKFIEIIKDAAEIAKYVPNSIQMYGAWIDKDPVHVVMSYIEGETLREKIDETDGKGLEAKEARNLLLELVRAINDAHKAGITHCNIKPLNIILDKNNEPYISPLSRYQKINEKFIFEKYADRIPNPADNSYREDLCYLPPEIFDKDYFAGLKDRNEKIDQYMLGLIGYDILTGAIPQTVTTFETIINFQVKAFKELDKIADKRQDCPTKLSDIIHRMIDIDPDKRYDNLSDVLDELEKLTFDCIQLAKESYARCITNNRLTDGFIKAFYDELISISQEASDMFKGKGIGEDKTHRQYEMLREAIFMLFMFAEDKIDKTDKKKPNVLTRIAERHNQDNYNIPAPMYDDFLIALTNTVCGTVQAPEPFDECVKVSEREKNRIKEAWQKALEPGIAYMIRKYYNY